MYAFLLFISLAMILYGIIRYVVAAWRRESNSNIHVLWIPGAAVLYACGVAVCTWVL